MRAVRPRKISPLGEKFSGTSPEGHTTSFTNYAMLRDSRAFFGISGEMHYCRVSPAQWEDAILKRKKASGRRTEIVQVDEVAAAMDGNVEKCGF